MVVTGRQDVYLTNSHVVPTKRFPVYGAVVQGSLPFPTVLNKSGGGYRMGIQSNIVLRNHSPYHTYKGKFMKTHVLLVGNSSLKNQGICSHISKINNSIIFETTTEFDQLPKLLLLHQPDLLLVLLEDWEDQFYTISHRLPPVNILCLSALNEQICLTLIRKSIINGCLPETAPPDLLIQAIYAVANGYTWFKQSSLKAILHPISQPDRKQSILTDEELTILRLVMLEKTNKEIARVLEMSNRIVCERLSQIYRKLGVTSRVGAALKAERLGLYVD